ncbi:MAG: BrnA antitoxin family protein [Pseudomonadota bacterium]
MKKPPIVQDNTPEEEAEIQRQIAEDPDTWAMPRDARVIKRGRPTGRTKQKVTVRLDKAVIDKLKSPDSKGWQTRLNAAARRGLQLD